jgi:hypothetical protein
MKAGFGTGSFGPKVPAPDLKGDHSFKADFPMSHAHELVVEVASFAVGLLIYAGIFMPPFMRILRRVGLSRWWALLFFVPILNLVALWLLACARWPAEESQNADKRD